MLVAVVRVQRRPGAHRVPAHAAGDAGLAARRRPSSSTRCRSARTSSTRSSWNAPPAGYRWHRRCGATPPSERPHTGPHRPAPWSERAPCTSPAAPEGRGRPATPPRLTDGVRLTCTITEFAGSRTGTWRSLVAHLTGGQGVAGSNPVVPTGDSRRSGPVSEMSGTGPSSCRMVVSLSTRSPVPCAIRDVDLGDVRPEVHGPGQRGGGRGDRARAVGIVVGDGIELIVTLLSASPAAVTASRSARARPPRLCPAGGHPLDASWAPSDTSPVILVIR